MNKQLQKRLAIMYRRCQISEQVAWIVFVLIGGVGYSCFMLYTTISHYKSSGVATRIISQTTKASPPKKTTVLAKPTPSSVSAHSITYYTTPTPRTSTSQQVIKTTVAAQPTPTISPTQNSINQSQTKGNTIPLSPAPTSTTQHPSVIPGDTKLAQNQNTSPFLPLTISLIHLVKSF